MWLLDVDLPAKAPNRPHPVYIHTGCDWLCRDLNSGTPVQSCLLMRLWKRHIAPQQEEVVSCALPFLAGLSRFCGAAWHAQGESINTDEFTIDRWTNDGDTPDKTGENVDEGISLAYMGSGWTKLVVERWGCVELCRDQASPTGCAGANDTGTAGLF